MVLLIDGTLDYLEIGLLNDKKEFIDIFFVKQEKNLTKILVSTIRFFLDKNDIKDSDISSIYVINGPGSFTSVKLISVYANLWKTIYPNIELYSINTCLWNATNNKSFVYLDAKSNLFFYLINDQNLSNNILMIEKDELNLIIDKYINNEYEIIDCKIKQDMQKKFNWNFTNFIKVDKIIPLYIKDAI